ncbi:hypothetical protein ACOME3_001866 [Neoechinorhynchus agilis]
MFSFYPVLYTGDDTDALVFDPGSFDFRFGHAGSEYPQFVVKPCVGSDSKARHFIGDVQLNNLISDVEVDWAVKNGEIEDWKAFELLLEYSYCRLNTTPSDHPVMFVESPLNPLKKQENLCELMFEKFHVPAFYLCRSPALACISVGRPSGLVIDQWFIKVVVLTELKLICKCIDI